jgi:hypothetical protein
LKSLLQRNLRYITKRGSFGSGDGQFNTPISIDEDEIDKKCVRNRYW